MSRQARRNNDAAALGRRRWVTQFNPEEATMDEKACMALAVEAGNELEVQNKAKGMKATAGPMAGKLGDVLTWLRGQNVPWAKIFAMLPQIVAALSAGNWAAVIAALITIFGLPPGTEVPPAP